MNKYIIVIFAVEYYTVLKNNEFSKEDIVE